MDTNVSLLVQDTNIKRSGVLIDTTVIKMRVIVEVHWAFSGWFGRHLV